MQINQVEGRDCGKIMLYALSTCGWCRRTKKLLNELGVEYSFIDVDLLTGDDKKMVVAEIKKHNPRISFPTVVFRDEKAVIGFDEDAIKEEVKNG